MGTTRFKGENASERLDFSGISDSDMIQVRHKPGTVEDADKGISKANLCSCPFGVSDTLAASAAKTAALTDSNPDFTLVSGREVVVCFTTANTASSPSLNFAGSGSIPIYYPDGSAVGDWPAGTWMHLKYFSASIGGSTIQRWILLSPLPVDTVALNNMHSVTSNAVARVLGEKITDYTVGNGYTFNGTIVKIGKIVFVDGKVINSIHSNSGNILSNLPVNASGVGKDQNVWWLSSDWTSIVGYSILSFDNGNNNLAIGIGSAPVGSTQISFSYISI